MAFTALCGTVIYVCCPEVLFQTINDFQDCSNTTMESDATYPERPSSQQIACQHDALRHAAESGASHRVGVYGPTVIQLRSDELGGEESTSKGEDCKANGGIAHRHGMSAAVHRETLYVAIDVCLADVVASAMCCLTAIEDTSSSTVRVPEHCRLHQRGGCASCLVHTAFVASTMDCWDSEVLKDDGRAVIQTITEPCDHTLWIWSIPHDGCIDGGVAGIGRNGTVLLDHKSISGKHDLGKGADRRWREGQFTLLDEPGNKSFHSRATCNGSVICLQVWGVASATVPVDCFPNDAVDNGYDIRLSVWGVASATVLSDCFSEGAMDAAGLRDEPSGLRTGGKCGVWARSHWGMRRTPTGWTSLSQHKKTMRRTDEVHCTHEFARRLLEAVCGRAGDHHASVNHGC